jgi:hypothetical protein
LAAPKVSVEGWTDILTSCWSWPQLGKQSTIVPSNARLMNFQIMDTPEGSGVAGIAGHFSGSGLKNQ